MNDLSQKTVAIEVRPDRVDVILHRGSRVISARRLTACMGEDSRQWMHGLTVCANDIKRCVDELEVHGARAAVYCESPSLAVDLISSEMVSTGDALRAANLACHDAVSYSSEVAVSDAAVVVRDQSGKERRAHVIVSVERSDVICRIAEVIEQAGLRLDFVSPSAAPIIALATNDAMTGELRCSGVLHIGQHSSFFAVAKKSRLIFGRQVHFGLEQLIRSMTREISGGSLGKVVHLDFSRAASILLEHGIPERDEVVDAESGLVGAHIMPSIQPGLQRFLVELRQSLRFGLQDEERSELTIAMSGPGGRLPGLAKLLESELGVKVEVPQDAIGFDATKPGSPGSDLAVAAARRDRADTLRLIPRALQTSRRIKRFKKWALAGTAVALGLIAFDAHRLNVRITAAEKVAGTLTMQRTAQESLSHTRNRLLAFHRAVAELRNTIREEMSGSDSFAPVMKEIGLTTSEGIQISSMDLMHEGELTEASITGIASATADRDAGAVMSDYFAALGSSPLIDEVNLKNVYRTEHNGVAAERFEINFAIVTWPVYNDSFIGVQPAIAQVEHGSEE